jgi:superfamily II DNA or RNA helicase
MIKLIADPVYTRIFNLSIDDVHNLQDILYYMSPGYFFTQAYQRGSWDGSIKLINKDEYSDEYRTYTGLVYKILKYFKEKSIEYKIQKTYDYSNLKIEDNKLQNIELRDYQIEAINEFKNRKRGIINIPTGGGKTVIFIKLAIDFNLKTLIVLNRNTLVEQTFLNFKKYVGFKDNELNVIGGSRNYVNKNNSITIATYQSLLTGKYNDIIQNTEFLIMDETHHAAAQKIGEIVMKANNALVKVGVSATPIREDKLTILIEAYLGKIIYTKTPSELINAGYLAKPYIYFIDCENDFNPKVSYAGLYKHLVSFKKRNDIAARCAYEFAKMGKTTLISIVRVAHADEILKSLKEIDDIGFNIKIITGKDSSDEKIKTIKKMNNGQYPIVISTLFGEGVDIPCMTGDTEIKLLNGSIETLKQLYDKEIKDFWVYSISKDGNIQPARANRIVLSKKNVEVIKIMLDNNKSFKCTSDHKIMMRDGTYKEAKDLKENDSLMPLYYKRCRVDKNGYGYEIVYNPKDRTYIPTHRIVSEFYNGKQEYGTGKKTVHHKNFNKIDNTPDNLQLMEYSDHSRYHCQINSEMQKKKWQDPEYRKKMLPALAERNGNIEKRLKQANTLKQTWKTKGKNYWKTNREDITKKGLNTLYCHIQEDPMFLKRKFKINLKKFENEEDFIEKYIECKCNMTKMSKKYDCKVCMLNSIAHFFNIKLGKIKIQQWKNGKLDHPLKNKKFSIKHCKNISESKKGKNKGIITPQLIAMWKANKEKKKNKDIKNNLPNNHKVKSIIKCKKKEDVYDIELVEPNHNFALANGVFVHNCLSSLINCRATKSITDLKQQVGRTLRLKKNKENPIVIDFYDYNSNVIEYNKALKDGERRAKDYFKSYANKKMKSIKTEPEFELKRVSNIEEMFNDVKLRENK